MMIAPLLTLLLLLELSGDPCLRVDRDHHDFGTVKQGEELDTRFTLTNEGDGDLIIRKIRHGCGCLVLNQLENKVIPPGEKVEMEVKLLTKHRSMTLMKNIHIDTNDPKVKTTVLKIKAFIHVDYYQARHSLIFEDVEEGAQVSRRIDIQSFMEQPLAIRDFMIPFDYVSCVFGRDEEKKVCYIEVRLDLSNHALGTKTERGRIFFKTNSEQLPEGSINLYIQPAREIKVQPASVMLYRQEDGGRESAVIRITAAKGRKFSIKKYNLPLDSVDVEILDEGNPSPSIRLALKEDIPLEQASTHLSLWLEGDTDEVIEIPVRIFITKMKS